jgi:hypothetical protein
MHDKYRPANDPESPGSMSEGEMITQPDPNRKNSRKPSSTPAPIAADRRKAEEEELRRSERQIKRSRASGDFTEDFLILNDQKKAVTQEPVGLRKRARTPSDASDDAVSPRDDDEFNDVPSEPEDDGLFVSEYSPTDGTYAMETTSPALPDSPTPPPRATQRATRATSSQDEADTEDKKDEPVTARRKSSKTPQAQIKAKNSGQHRYRPTILVISDDDDEGEKNAIGALVLDTTTPQGEALSDTSSDEDEDDRGLPQPGTRTQAMPKPTSSSLTPKGPRLLDAAGRGLNKTAAEETSRAGLPTPQVTPKRVMVSNLIYTTLLHSSLSRIGFYEQDARYSTPSPRKLARHTSRQTRSSDQL